MPESRHRSWGEEFLRAARNFTLACAIAAFGCCAGNVFADSSRADAAIKTLKSGWDKPARTCKPHTRWWWPGNALTKTDITWQLEQMAGQGIGGVEIMSTWQMYEKGNIGYSSELLLNSMAVGVIHRSFWHFNAIGFTAQRKMVVFPNCPGS